MEEKIKSYLNLKAILRTPYGVLLFVLKGLLGFETTN